MQFDQFSDILFQKCQLDAHKPLVAGISGGPDSLCMLHLLNKTGMQIFVLHVNHQLRNEADHEAEVVKNYCGQNGINCLIVTGDVKEIASEKKISIEEAARIFRYKSLFAYAKKINAQAVLVAHNANDQAETVLMHLLRGSGLSGLRGMEMRSIQPVWSDDIALVRPLLNITREQILAYCKENTLSPTYDPSNQDTRYFRNRIRQELLPELATYNPKIMEHLTSLSAVIANEDAYLAKAAQKAWQDSMITEGRHFILFEISQLKSLHPALLRRVLRLAITRIDPSLRDVDYAVTERAVHFLDSDSKVNHIHLPANIELLKSQHKDLIICNQNDCLTDLWPQIDFEKYYFVPNHEMELGSGWKLRCVETDHAEVHSRDGRNAVLDAELLDGLIINVRKDGDRFAPYGLKGKVIKLGDYWTKTGLPEKVRGKWPLLRNGNGEIVWVIGMQVSDRFKVTAKTKKMLVLNLIYSPEAN